MSCITDSHTYFQTERKTAAIEDRPDDAVDQLTATMAKIMLNDDHTLSLSATSTVHLLHRAKKLVTRAFITTQPSLYNFLLSCFSQSVLGQREYARISAAAYFDHISRPDACRGMSIAFLEATDKKIREDSTFITHLFNKSHAIFFQAFEHINKRVILPHGKTNPRSEVIVRDQRAEKIFFELVASFTNALFMQKITLYSYDETFRFDLKKLLHNNNIDAFEVELYSESDDIPIGHSVTIITQPTCQFFDANIGYIMTFKTVDDLCKSVFNYFEYSRLDPKSKYSCLVFNTLKRLQLAPLPSHRSPSLPIIKK
jgi:hypothetical protein